MTAMMVSVIVPVYNAAAYLPALAAEFARQAGDAFEVVFVDDGSTDDSLAILNRIAAEGQFRAVVVAQQNAGASAARNAGMRAARGKYIAFVDADDMIAPDYLRALCAFAENGDALTVFRHARTVGAQPVFEARSGARTHMQADDLLALFLQNPTRFGVYDFLIRRDLIERAYLRFPEGYPYYEDYDFTLRLFDAVGGAVHIDHCLYCYRAAPGSAMSTFSEERMRCLELFDETRSQHLRHRRVFYQKFELWFVARLCWSVMWQASVSMDARAALAFARRHGIRGQMRRLADFPDKRVSASARAFVRAPRLFIFMMKALGAGRTLLARESARASPNQIP